MIDPPTLARLRHLLSEHGDVQHLRALPSSTVDHDGCLILATMHTIEAARKLQQQYGFSAYGVTSLIIPDRWLKHHLTEDTL